MFQRILIAVLLAAPLVAVAAENVKGETVKSEDKAKTPKSQTKMSQPERMKSCNKEAGEKALKGDERKKFMSQCLKGPAKS